MLDPSDFDGVSFLIISAALVAATYFFTIERDRAVAGDGGDASLKLIYNLADFVNKIAFGGAIWAAATSAHEAED
jgi:hypothetical protein